LRKANAKKGEVPAMNRLTRNNDVQVLGLLLPLDTLETPPELTPREREVLCWLATGKTDPDIAALLGISVRTVHKHLEHIYVKLGVETRTAAVMRALGAWGVEGIGGIGAGAQTYNRMFNQIKQLAGTPGRRLAPSKRKHATP
jgi:DNA-binding CsgD family transcriptional regulator